MGEESGTRLPHLADAADIERWAVDKVNARTDFPRLVRRLIRQTNDQVVALEMRADKGTGYAGYDGRVEASRGSPLVPQGLSVWELGVGEAPGTKANEDFKKRTEEPLDVNPGDAVFVFATARRWPGKTKWAAEKRAEGTWRDVKAFDADDLETAFEAAPGAHFWFSELVGKPASGIRTIEDWWSSFSRTTQPNLTPELILAGRSDEAAALLRILEEETRITTISAASADDVLAFVAATLLSGPGLVREDLLARTLIVHDALALRVLDSTSDLLILLPFEDRLRREAQLVRSHHVIFLAPEGVPCDLEVPRIDRSAFAAALGDLGVDEKRARQFAAAAYRSLVAYQQEARALGVAPRVWSSAFTAKIVRRAWLVGSWHEARSGDTDVLGVLFGTAYEDARAELATHASGEDPLFTTVGASWALTSAEQAWDYGAAHINATDLSALEGVIQVVLGAIDPSLEHPVEERWKASLYGKTRVHSSDLRKGLSTTLALFGAFGGGKQIGSIGTSADWATSIIAQVLRRANEDVSGHLWASLSDVLPLLAEAAPDAFLRAVQEGVSGEASVLATMFIDQVDAFSVSSPHTGLLWALETVAWSSEHASLAAKLLARLSEIDPGGRLSNRPINSLADFFRSWLPQTSLSMARRLKVLDTLRRDHEEISWQLMLKLLPEPHSVGSYTHSPLFRSWKPEREGVTRAEFWEFSSAVAQRMLEDAKRQPGRWADFVDRLDDFPPPERAAAMEQLSELAGSEGIKLEVREQLWGQLDKLIRQHRKFADADWSLPSEELDRMAEVANLLVPTDPVAANRWLFDEHFPDLGVLGRDFSEREEEVIEARSAAVERVLAEEGFDGLLRLTTAIQYPWFVGTASAAHASVELDGRIIQLLDHEERKLIVFASGYVSQRARIEGLSWIQEWLEHVSGRPVVQARLLLVSDDLLEAWRIATELGDEIEQAYWQEFSPMGRGPDFQLVDEAARSLLRFGRPIVALDLMALYARKEDKRVSHDLIADGLEQLVRLPKDHDELQQLSNYEIEVLLEYLRDSDLDEERLGMLEWQLLPALGFEARSPVLERRLARDPSFFIEILSLVYKSRGEEVTKEVPQHVASNAYRLLSEWKIVPGSGDRKAEVNEDELGRWLSDAQRLLDESGRREIGDVQIGQVFAHAREDEDGTWPTLPVRNAIERLASPEIEEGFAVQIYNNRGVTSRGLAEGGRPERDLAKDFSKRAELIRDEWPRTAAVLSSIASGYEREAARHDEEAERFRQGLGE